MMAAAYAATEPDHNVSEANTLHGADESDVADGEADYADVPADCTAVVAALVASAAAISA